MRERPLEVNVEGDELVIRIGLGTLAWCAEHNPLFYQYDRHDESPEHGHGEGPYCKVEDQEQLGHDVVRQLLHEQEDGTTPLHLLFDHAIQDAVDDGSMAFAEDSW